MSRPLVVLRPEPGLTSTLVAAFGLGLKATGMPLCTVSAAPWKAPAEQFDGILLGSANAIRHAGAELEKVTHLPVLCVGEATARLARDAGMSVERTGSGGLQSVLHQIDGETRHLLRLAGETHLPLKVPASVTVETCITYRAHYHSLSDPQVSLLRDGATVLLHSGEMAEHFASQCDAAALDRAAFDCIAMAPRIAERAGAGWHSMTVAQHPDDASLLAAARELCDKP